MTPFCSGEQCTTISSQSGTAFYMYYSELEASQLRKFELARFPRTLINSISWCNCIFRLCALCFFRPNFLLFSYSFLLNDIYMQARTAIDFRCFPNMQYKLSLLLSTHRLDSHCWFFYVLNIGIMNKSLENSSRTCF